MSRVRSQPGPQSKKSVSTICPTCGKEFWYYPSWPRKYCSHACAGKTNIGNVQGFQASSYTATCEQCGKQFKATAKRTRGRFCSRTCYGKWLSANTIGPKHPTFGRKYGRPKYLPPATLRTCPMCACEFAIKPSHAARRRFCSKRCQAQWLSQTMNGEDNPAWNGGYEPYYGPSWRPAQRAIRERDEVCQLCGMTAEQNGRELDVHHISPFRLFGVERHEEANALTNLLLLCHDCHLKYEWSTNREWVRTP